MILNREEDQVLAMGRVEPILTHLYGILDHAVSFYFGDRYTDAARAEHSNTTAANCIYSHAETEMIRVADRVDGLSRIRVRQLHILNFRDLIVARFKKVKANGRHSNYLTLQQLDYDDQKTIPRIPDPAIRLTVGYQLDPTGTALERIMIARPIGRQIFWTSQVIVVDEVASWTDITPRRFVGMDVVDFDIERVRRGRGGR
jgi:hypothetical protein